MKDHLGISPDIVWKSLLDFTDHTKLNVVIQPVFNSYNYHWAQGDAPRVFDNSVQSIGNIDPIFLKQIDEIHTTRSMIKLLVIGTALRKAVEENTLEREIYENVSREICLTFDTAVILEIAKRLHNAPLDLDALYKVIKEDFDTRFGRVLLDIPDNDHKRIFTMAFNKVSRLASGEEVEI